MLVFFHFSIYLSFYPSPTPLFHTLSLCIIFSPFHLNSLHSFSSPCLNVYSRFNSSSHFSSCYSVHQFPLFFSPFSCLLSLTFKSSILPSIFFPSFFHVTPPPHKHKYLTPTVKNIVLWCCVGMDTKCLSRIINRFLGDLVPLTINF